MRSYKKEHNFVSSATGSVLANDQISQDLVAMANAIKASYLNKNIRENVDNFLISTVGNAPSQSGSNSWVVNYSFIDSYLSLRLRPYEQARWVNDFAASQKNKDTSAPPPASASGASATSSGAKGIAATSTGSGAKKSELALTDELDKNMFMMFYKFVADKEIEKLPLQDKTDITTRIITIPRILDIVSICYGRNDKLVKNFIESAFQVDNTLHDRLVRSVGSSMLPLYSILMKNAVHPVPSDDFLAFCMDISFTINSILVAGNSPKFGAMNICYSMSSAQKIQELLVALATSYEYVLEFDPEENSDNDDASRKFNQYRKDEILKNTTQIFHHIMIEQFYAPLGLISMANIKKVNKDQAQLIIDEMFELLQTLCGLEESEEKHEIRGTFIVNYTSRQYDIFKAIRSSPQEIKSLADETRMSYIDSFLHPEADAAVANTSKSSAYDPALVDQILQLVPQIGEVGAIKALKDANGNIEIAIDIALKHADSGTSGSNKASTASKLPSKQKKENEEIAERTKLLVQKMYDDEFDDTYDGEGVGVNDAGGEDDRVKSEMIVYKGRKIKVFYEEDGTIRDISGKRIDPNEIDADFMQENPNHKNPLRAQGGKVQVEDAGAKDAKPGPTLAQSKRYKERQGSKARTRGNDKKFRNEFQS